MRTFWQLPGVCLKALFAALKHSALQTPDLLIHEARSTGTVSTEGPLTNTSLTEASNNSTKSAAQPRDLAQVAQVFAAEGFENHSPDLKYGGFCLRDKKKAVMNSMLQLQ